MKFLIWVVANALAVAVATWWLEGLTVTTEGASKRLGTMLAVGLILGLINAIVGPVLKLVSLPFILLTFGLLLLVINALLLLLTGKIAEQIGLGFEVDGFWPAFWGGIIISIVGILLPGTQKRLPRSQR